MRVQAPRDDMVSTCKGRNRIAVYEVGLFSKVREADGEYRKTPHRLAVTEECHSYSSCSRVRPAQHHSTLALATLTTLSHFVISERMNA